MPEIEVDEVPVGITLPDDELGMVIMQPYVELCPTEPFKWPASLKSAQIGRIKETLDIAQKAKHGCDRTHFTLLPEYTIPGLEGFRVIQDTLENSSWPEDTVVIGGLDGLAKNEYTDLCDLKNVTVDSLNAPDVVRDGQWVNCCCTWVKSRSDDGKPIVQGWIQPKLRPAWEEMDVPVNDMFEGKKVHIFEGSSTKGLALRFLSVICIDWISDSGEYDGIKTVLKKANELEGAAPYGRPIHLAAVLKLNPKPNHPAFLSYAYAFFHDAYEFVERRDCVICFVNGAGAQCPGPCQQYGYSSLIFSADSPYSNRTSPPSYALATKKYRGSEDLQTCKEALFRENGECVHSFRLFHPLSVSKTPSSSRRIPLSPVIVHSLNSASNDPRLPNEQVPAAVKWVNDKLDAFQVINTDPNIATVIEVSHNKIKGDMKWASNEYLTNALLAATSGMSKESASHVDVWDDPHSLALETTFSALTLLNCFEDVIIKNAPTQAFLVHNNDVFDILVVAGRSHDKNIGHVKELHHGSRYRKTLIVSRDKNDGPLLDRDKSICKAIPDENRCSYHDLKECVTAQSDVELKTVIKGKIGSYNA
ncbi:MAG: hypothetical protein GY861_04825 [bacterium]|nr:hypothetical protein [bacterium]